LKGVSSIGESRAISVDIPKLKDRTGFDGSKIRNIIYQLSNQGKIKKISRGVYTLA
jgi:ribosomal protein S25